GEELEARSHLSAVAELVSTGSLVWGYGVTAAALLELGLGRPAEAAKQLAVLAASDTAGEPSLFDWQADWIEALLRHGRTSEASDVLRRFAADADRSERPSARACAARCRGLLAPARRFDADFEQAIRLHQTVPTPFERARTELCYGERLRRSRRVHEARPLLQSALSTFERLGSGPWAARAQRELSSPRWSKPGAVNPSELLTVRELEVASLVARGARNREAAAALFVSEKTVEFHLTAIYGKLGVRSRTELTRRLLQ
ncbi:MAG TPA: response regulator transcription factor, partial [Candidatus Limnocylindrales bacterium]|nr:response regulator transcription factor [Candidatus Limnocylindrales bacterium]